MKRLALLLPLLALAAPLNSTADDYGDFSKTVEISPSTETDYGFWLREDYDSILKSVSFSCAFPLELESQKFVAAKFIGLSDETRPDDGIRNLHKRAFEIEMRSRVVGDVFGECRFEVKSNETARCYLVLCYTAPDNTGFIVDDECDFYVFPLRTYASERPAYRILSLVPHFCQPDHLRDFYVPSQREKWDEREKDVLAALEKARAAETRPDVSEQLQLLQRKWTRLFEIRAKRKPRPEDPAAPSPAEETHAEPEPRAASAEHRLDEVKELYATGEYAKARTRLEAVLKDEPGNERARSLLLRVVDRERREQEDDLRWQDLRRQAIKSVQPCRRPEGRDKAAREEDPMATSATPSPAEEKHAESAETAEPEPHAESAEQGEGSEEAEPSPSVAPPPAP
jgi:hypothetical protein